MNARKNFLTFGGIALVAVTGWATMTACSSDNAITPSNDAGGDTSMSGSSSGASGSGSTTGSTSGSASGGSGMSSGDDSGPPDATAGSGSSSGTDGGAGDAIVNCTSDATTCNSCTTDPYNACSSYTVNCIPFDDTKVPTHPTL